MKTITATDESLVSQAQSTEQIHAQLQTLRLAIRKWHMTRGLALTCGTILLLCVLSFIADFLLHIDRTQRTLWLILASFSVLYVCWNYFLSPMITKPNDHWLLLQIEKFHPELRLNLVSTWELLLEKKQHPEQAELIDLAISQGLREIRHITTDHLLDHKRHQQFNLLLVFCIAMMLLVAAQITQNKKSYLRLWFQRNILLMDLRWPQTTFFELENLQFDDQGQAYMLIAQGDDWRLPVKIRGRVPNSVWIDWTGSSRISSNASVTGPKQSKRLPTVSKGNYLFSLNNVRWPVKFQLRGGDGQSELVELRVVELPLAKQLNLFALPPAYTNLQTEFVWQYGDADMSLSPPVSQLIYSGVTTPLRQSQVNVLNHAAIELTGLADQPIKSGYIKMSRRVGVTARSKNSFQAKLASWKLPLEIVNPDQFRLYIPRDHPVIKHGSGHVQFVLALTGQHGLIREEALSWNMLMEEDKLPQTKASLMGIGSMVTPRAKIPFNIHITDDFGVKSYGLKSKLQLPSQEADDALDDKITQQINPKSFTPIRSGDNQKLIKQEWPFELNTMTLPIGTLLQFSIAADDFFERDSNQKYGLSTAFFLRVVDDQEMRTHLLQREQEYRQEFERTTTEQGFLVAESQGFIGQLNLTQTDLSLGDKGERLAKINSSIRKQNLMASRARSIHRQFSQIYLEVINNRIEDTRGPLQRRLQRRVLQPLDDLYRIDINKVSQMMDIGRSQYQKNQMEDVLHTWKKVLNKQQDIERKMKDILKAMLKAEGFQEAVNMALEIYSAQEKVNQKTVQAKLKEIENLFD